VRRVARKSLREYENSMHELLSDPEKESSKLFQELDQVLQGVARAMGFQRPMILEITRSTRFNAFVHHVEKQGAEFDKPSDEPLHVYVHAGFVQALHKVFQEKGKKLSKDHLAGILGHELRHLQQPEYNMDEARYNTETTRRYEYDADTAGMEAADRALYNPQATIETFNVFLEMSKGSLGAFADFFSTHPLDENRVKELLAQYHQPDRLFFASDKPYEPFSDEALLEAGDLTREALRESLKKARTEEDFERIFSHIERDPKSSFRDMELTLLYFKIYLDARTALAAAAEELQTGALGLRDAFVYTANTLLYAEANNEPVFFCLDAGAFNEKHPSLMGPSQETQVARRFHVKNFSDFENIPSIGQEYLTALQASGGAEEAWRQDASPDAVRRESARSMVRFAEQHSLLVPLSPDAGPFHTFEDLFDLTNEACVRLWAIPAEATEEQRQALVNQARRRILFSMSRLLWGQVKGKVIYQAGEEKNKKLEVIKVLEEAAERSEGEEILLHEANTEAGVKVVEPEVSGALPKGWDAVRDAISRRVSRSEVPERGGPSLDVGKVEFPLEFILNAFAFLGPVLARQGEAPSTPLQKLCVQFLHLAREKFDADLDQKKTGLPDHPKMKDWLFQRYMTETIDPTGKLCFPFSMPSEAAEWSAAVEYAARVPTFVRRREDTDFPKDVQCYQMSSPVTHQSIDEDSKGLLSGMLLADLEERLQRVELSNADDLLERVRAIRFHPIKHALFRTEKKEGIPPALMRGKNFFGWSFSSITDLKGQAFERLLRQHLPTSEGERRGLLKEPAVARKLPPTLFLPPVSEILEYPQGWGKFLDFFSPASSKRSGQRFKQREETNRNLSRLATELFAAHVADDAEELSHISSFDFIDLGSRVSF
jgi:hypothetical protein